ncbi:MAG: polysulfide reductase NrfD [Phycisphaerales bacterium]|nr:polysulfide reductase NrfD [Phycisphaerales bacterium]
MMNHTLNAAAAAIPLHRSRSARAGYRATVRAWVTPFNVWAVVIIAAGLPITYARFTQGLASVTNLTDASPWGLWIGFDVLCGVALAAGGFVMASAVHLFGLHDYKPLVRPAILTGFLGYFFVVIGLMYDLGRPWRLPYPLFYSPGVTSVMFEVALCVALYLTVQFIEFCPAVFEWLGWRSARQWAVRLTIGASAFGVILSTLHQSALGALFLIAPGKVHPLWYSPHIPILFFISAVAAGMSMVIVESTLSHRAFPVQTAGHDITEMDRLVLGLGKAAAVVLMTYFALKCLALAHGRHWHLLLTPYGAWWLVEMLGFVLLPCVMFTTAVRKSRAGWARWAAVVTVCGIVLNRLNVSIITYRWNAPDRYVPNWREIIISLMIVTLGLLSFRWIVTRMAVLRDDLSDAALLRPPTRFSDGAMTS